MNFLENNSTKIAGILCTATLLPVAGTVMAMELKPGWTEDDKYVTESGHLATGWQEIDGENYYFDETGSLDTARTAQAVTAQASSMISTDLKENIRKTVEEAQGEEAVQAFSMEAEEEAAMEAPEAETEVPAVSETPAEPAAPVIPAEPEAEVPAEPETPVVPETPAQPETPVIPAEPEAEAPVQPETPAEPEAPAVPELPAEPAPEVPVQPETPVVPETPVEPEAPAVPEIPAEPAPEVPVQPETPVVPEAPVEPETPVQPGGQYDQLNQNIVNAAMNLVGVTNGWQCTEVATAALNNAGVAAGVVWPDQYTQYGYVTDTPVAGNLIYYNQGGRGQDHIAIYIGNGMAVHGNFDGQTIVASAYLPGAVSTTYIQVVA